MNLDMQSLSLSLSVCLSVCSFIPRGREQTVVEFFFLGITSAAFLIVSFFLKKLSFFPINTLFSSPRCWKKVFFFPNTPLLKLKSVGNFEKKIASLFQHKMPFFVTQFVAHFSKSPFSNQKRVKKPHPFPPLIIK